MPSVASILADFATLSQTEQNIVKTSLMLRSTIGHNLAEYVEKERFSEHRLCPHCGSAAVVRNGKRKDGTQRYICKDCKKSFVATSNSIASGSRKPIWVWEKYVECMLFGLSLNKTAAICRIHRNTAFYWRHKFLDALQKMADDVKLNGIIEADETFFAVSYKGNHTKSTTPLPRTAHKRGHMCNIRGLSKEKVCVPCAVNREWLSIAKISNLARIRIKGLECVFGGRIEAGSAFVTDKASSYKQFTANNGLDLKQVKSGTHTIKGLYNIQHINNYHSRLKGFLKPFNGVSTKYLNNYLNWHNFVNYSKGDLEYKRDALLSYVLSVQFTEFMKEVHNRSQLPVVA